MRSTKLVILFALSLILLFTMVAAATAEPDSGMGTVYGLAEMQPVVSIAISGAGSQPMGGEDGPLWYRGRKGDTVGEWNNREVTVSNTGDGPADLFVAADMQPSNGMTSWGYADVADANNCVWTFGPFANVTQFGWNHLGQLEQGDSESFGSSFTFPTSYSGGDFNMSAMVIADGEMF